MVLLLSPLIHLQVVDILKFIILWNPIGNCWTYTRNELIGEIPETILKHFSWNWRSVIAVAFIPHRLKQHWYLHSLLCSSTILHSMPQMIFIITIFTLQHRINHTTPVIQKEHIKRDKRENPYPSTTSKEISPCSPQIKPPNTTCSSVALSEIKKHEEAVRLKDLVEGVKEREWVWFYFMQSIEDRKGDVTCDRLKRRKRGC